MKITPDLPDLIESFFLERLITQRHVSQHTIASYRDTFRLVLQFAKTRLDKKPSQLKLDDLTSQFILEFLSDLEKKRQCTARTRNQRLAAVRSFYHYLAFKVPERSALVQQVLAIPQKRHDKVLIDFLNDSEIESLLAAPDQKSWVGRRDFLLLSVIIQTGLRLSELTGLTWNDISFGCGANVKVNGKGRKERAIPLPRELSTKLESWRRIESSSPDSVVFPSQKGGRLSADAVQRLLSKHVKIAQEKCSSLKKKNVTPHVLRHSTAIRLLQAGVGQAVIALWLGHESVETTQIYLNADLKMKENVLQKTSPIRNRYKRYRPPDRVLSFLEGL
jgi:integrase/recombinase XerD